MFRSPFGVLRDLRQTHVRLHDVKTSSLKRRLKSTQLPEVFPKGHDTRVGLVTDDGRHHHLATGLLGNVFGFSYRGKVDVASGFHEEMNDIPPN
ncbi:unannotated protein [freshwater metagenome]|uniref:Unannotated protein n=1 Tax=freshwater metagenome TaxID=449393 RepID=A0A6J7PMN2_9ZZZZ